MVTHTTFQKFRVSVFLCSQKLHLLDQKYSKKLQYCEILLQF